MEKEKKIRPEDITVISAGEQIRRKILGSGHTVEEFAREVNLYPVSVKQYLRRNDGGSATFKIKVTQYFGQGYDEIVKDPQQQLNETCFQVSENIHLYQDEDDEEVILKLRELSIEEGLTGQDLWMDRNLALNRFYRNQVQESLDLLLKATEEAKNLKDPYSTATFAADIALMQYYRFEYEKALRWIETARNYTDEIEEINDKLLFTVAFRRGIIMSRLNQHESAQKCFTEALLYAENDTFKGLAHLHRAEAQHRVGLTQEAKESYRLALACLEEDPLRQSFVYNSFAEMLLDQNDLQRAHYFAEKALNCCEGDNVLGGFEHFETYAKIKTRMGGRKQVFDQLVALVDKASDAFVYRSQILEALTILMECHEEVGSLHTQQLESLIMRLIERASPAEVKYLKELKSMLAEVVLLGRR